MTQLSVNINKIATLRNARGGNNPNLLKVAADCERFGAQGITVHPRPDERHIRYQDVIDLAPRLNTEFNIEGNPTPEFTDLVLRVKPAQVTLVPDTPSQLTSNAGWDTMTHQSFLQEVIAHFKSAGIRTSIFIAPDTQMVKGATACGADRIELYTEPYATAYAAATTDEARLAAVAPFVNAATTARALGLGVNAGHDLSLDNLAFLHQAIPFLAEVSIGHALICDALYLGLEETIRRYRASLA
ncbi:MAG: pyridoxine 5'-phosphate synthase [Bacteroidales bacterium]|nr:pyridoxine 5'-phosphate synthase [Bacteroidales bacterium]